MRRVFVTADDYGYNPAVDEAILALMSEDRLSGASCMTRAPGWASAAARIAQAPAGSAFGLHLDFTGFSPVRCNLWPLILASLRGRLDPAALRAEISTQLTLFEDATGRAPVYVDGHQHVHQLPLIRDALIDVLTTRYAGRLPWLRISGARIGDGPKSLFIALLGAEKLQTMADAAHMRTLPRLLGAYGFDGNEDGYRRRLIGWLQSAADGDALMVHPAAQALPDDPIGAARVREYAVLSGHLPGLMAATATTTGRFSA